MRQRKRKRGQFGSKQDKGSSEDRKGVLQSVGRALAGKKSEAPNAPTAADPVSAKTPNFNVDKMLRSRGISIPEVTPVSKLVSKLVSKPTAPAAKPTAPAATPTAPAAKPTAPAAKPAAAPAAKPTAPAAAPTAPSKPTSREPAPYTPPKNDEELRARQGAAQALRAAVQRGDQLGEGFQDAKKQAKDAGVSESAIARFIEREDYKASAPIFDEDVEARQEAAGNLLKAMKMKEGAAKEQALEAASSQAYAAGVPYARVDRFINEPAFAKAEALRRVRAAGKKAAAAGSKPYQEPDIGKYDDGRPKVSREEYAERAANLRAQGFTGVKGDGGLAELYQMQADKASGVAPGTYTALSKGAKKIAPDSRIIDRYAKMVAEGRMSPEAAKRKFGEDMLDKMRYDDPRLFARNEAEYQAAVEEAKRTGSPIPERPLPGADINFADEARRFPGKSSKRSGNTFTGFGYTGVYDQLD
jgi:hypothetical protein